jgi:hypothetical protein
VAISGVRIRSLLNRLIEIVVGLLALSIAGLTVWTIVDTLVNPPNNGASTGTLWAIAYALGFGAFALATFALRLMVPRLRVEGNRIIGLRGATAFTIVYAAIVVVGISQAATLRPAIITPVLILAAGGVLVWDRLRRRPPK